jgi:uncharacterized membrane protein YczE
MRSAPALRGGTSVRAAYLVAGLFACSCGILCFLESGLGLSPWDVLHQGIAQHTPLSFGLANEAVALVVLVVAWALGARIWTGTVANALLVGTFVAVLEPLGIVSGLRSDSLGLRIGLLAIGMVLFGLGTAFYIGAAFGAGPRDSLMLVGSRRTGVRVGLVRTAIELTALAAGVALGGHVGVGTLVFAALIGPFVESSFWLVVRVGLTT